MLRGLYSSATGMITQYKKIDVLGNNISNINTDGYKRDDLSLKSFDEEITTRMTDNVPVGSLSDGVVVNVVSTDYTQGSMEQTFRDTDLGISGDGFFAVEASPGGGGVKYTRDGNFSVDPGGFLALSSGERLLDKSGQPVKTGGDNFTAASDGTLTLGGVTLGNISLYGPTGPNGIAKRTDGFFYITAPAVSKGKIMQGYIEGSNVNAVDEMSGMMQASRSFQSCQQAFQVNSDTLDKLINQVGSLRS
jgi:flagellar basal-body rod protein FlgF